MSKTILSVHDKSSVLEFARGLSAPGGAAIYTLCELDNRM
jgi:hypothetical protein